jgi:hypothetical protein
MKRLITILSLVLLLAVLTVPAIAQAGNGGGTAPTGWTWDEA